MDRILYRVHLNNELPQIGCGWRVVTVAIGRKWVRVRATVGSGKLSIKQWDSIAKTATQLPPRKKKRRVKSTLPPWLRTMEDVG